MSFNVSDKNHSYTIWNDDNDGYKDRDDLGEHDTTFIWISAKFQLAKANRKIKWLHKNRPQCPGWEYERELKKWEAVAAEARETIRENPFCNIL